MSKNFKKKFVFLSVFLFFFLSMLFLSWHISSRMFNNATIKQCMKDARNMQSLIVVLLSNEEQPLEKNLNRIINVIKATCNYPATLSAVIFSSDKKILYQWGKDYALLNAAAIEAVTDSSFLYNKTELLNQKVDVYEIFFPLNKNNKIVGFGKLTFNLSHIDSHLYQERFFIYIIIFVFNFFIYLFLLAFILLLERRVFAVEEDLSKYKTRDGLTDLYSKEHFFKLLKNEIERVESSSGRITLIVADIDSFMTINENYGYDFGDLIIKTVAGICTQSFRKFDILGRLGEDEIVILMVDSTEEEAFTASENCRLLIEENKFYYEGKEITVKASFGITCLEIEKAEGYNEEKEKFYFRSLIFNSLHALNKAKLQGGNLVIKYSEA